MSKVSQQQSSPSRDRMPTPVPKAKQPSKADANGNGAKAGASREVQAATSEYGIVPSESAEDDFFARGEANSSLPPAAMDVIAPELEDDEPESIPLTPAQLQRRARLRRFVGGVVGAAAVLTAVVGAKALAATSAKVAASDGSLNVPHRIVPSIALGAQEEPKSDKVTAGERGASPDPAAPSTPDPATVAGNSAPQGGSGEPTANQDPNAANQDPPARRLPVIDVEIPASTDPAIDQQWESAANKLASKDFKGADSAFAELGKRDDPATREAARLARAVWWTANGRHSEVKPVIADLAANATTPSVRAHARDLLRTN